MNPLIGGALISAGGGLAQGLFGIGKGKRNEQRNKRMMEYELKLNKQMFDYQNAYNLPKNQMMRLKNAGLNPALMYGQGTTGNATNAPQTKYTPTDVSTFDSSSLIGGIQQGAQMLLQKQQVDNLKAQEQETQSRTMLNTIEAAVKGGTKEEAKGLIRYQLENAKQENKTRIQNLANMKITNGILNANRTKAQIEAEDARIKKEMNNFDLQTMKRLKMSRIDHPMIKMLYRLSEDTAKSFEWYIKNFLGMLNNTPYIPFKQ